MKRILAAWAAGVLSCTPTFAAQRALDLMIQGGKPVGGTQAVRLVRGDDVLLTVRSDHDDELHLHGYDLHLHLTAGTPATLRFTAARTGRFSAELHHAESEVVVFEIYPR